MKLFDLKRFAINDGPGIRTTLFLKGCPLHCIWCHNPEGIAPNAQKLYMEQKCIGCQTCVDECPQQALTLTAHGIQSDAERCTTCGRCTEVCPTLALEMAGREWSLEEVMEAVEKERMVMETSGGGVTICGGEPLMHPDDVCALFSELGRRGIHRALDTTLYCSPSTLERILPVCDLLLVDLKHMDSAQHELYTGVPNEPILDNLRRVSSANARFWIRIPLIEGINADEDNLHATAQFLTRLTGTQPEQVCLLPYHDIGKGKHERLGTHYNPSSIRMETPSKEQQQAAINLLLSYGIPAKIGG